MQRSVNERGSRRRFGLLPVLAAVILMIAGLGLTCEEYVDLPRASESNSGDMFLSDFGPCYGQYAVVMRGDVKYKANPLPQWFTTHPKLPPLIDLKQSAHYALTEVSMRGGLTRESFLRLQPLGCAFGVEVRLDLHTWNHTTEEFETYYDEPIQGTHWFIDTMPVGKMCVPSPGDPTFDPNRWIVICSNVMALTGAEGGDMAHVNVPWGALKLNYVGAAGDWDHRIP